MMLKPVRLRAKIANDVLKHSTSMDEPLATQAIGKQALVSASAGRYSAGMSSFVRVSTTTITTGTGISMMGISIKKRCLPVVEVSESR